MGSRLCSVRAAPGRTRTVGKPRGWSDLEPRESGRPSPGCETAARTGRPAERFAVGAPAHRLPVAPPAAEDPLAGERGCERGEVPPAVPDRHRLPPSDLD